MWVPEVLSLFRSQAAQRVLANTAPQTGRVSAAVGRENLAAEMLFGGQQFSVIWGQHEQVHVSAAFTAHQ